MLVRLILPWIKKAFLKSSHAETKPLHQGCVSKVDKKAEVLAALAHLYDFDSWRAFLSRLGHTLAGPWRGSHTNSLLPCECSSLCYHTTAVAALTW